MSQVSRVRKRRGAKKGRVRKQAASRVRELRSALVAVFKRFDTSDEGFMPAKKLEEIARELGAPLEGEEIISAKHILDVDNSGKIEMHEFVHWWMATHQATEVAPQSSSKGRAAGGEAASRRDKRSPTRLGASGSTSSSAAGPPRGSRVRQDGLLEARRARQAASHDAQMLKNRIQLLKAEEQKTLKRIMEANAQATAIFTRKQNQKKKKVKEIKASRSQHRSRRGSQEDNYVKKELGKINKMRAAKAVSDKRLVLANSVKMERQELNRLRQKQNREFRKKAQRKQKSIRAAQERMRAEKMRRQEAQRRKAEALYMEKVEKERQLQRKKELRLRHLEKEEKELIARLQNAHVMQQDALQSLQRVIGGTVDPLDLDGEGLRQHLSNSRKNCVLQQSISSPKRASPRRRRKILAPVAAVPPAAAAGAGPES